MIGSPLTVVGIMVEYRPEGKGPRGTRDGMRRKRQMLGITVLRNWSCNTISEMPRNHSPRWAWSVLHTHVLRKTRVSGCPTDTWNFGVSSAGNAAGTIYECMAAPANQILRPTCAKEYMRAVLSERGLAHALILIVPSSRYPPDRNPSCLFERTCDSSSVAGVFIDVSPAATSVLVTDIVETVKVPGKFKFTPYT